MVETRHAFRFVYMLLGLLAVGALVALPAFAFKDVRTVTVEKPQPGLTAKSTVSEAQARYAGQAQQVDGQQLGLPAGIVCDAYELADGVSLVCYQGAAG